jgi:hypothetical protein
VTEEMVRGVVMVSHDLGRHAQYLADLIDVGADRVYLHHVGQQQDAFIEAFGEHVLPQLRSSPPAAPLTAGMAATVTAGMTADMKAGGTAAAGRDR